MIAPLIKRESFFPAFSGAAMTHLNVFADNSSGSQITGAAIDSMQYKMVHAEAYKGVSGVIDFPRANRTDEELVAARKAGAIMCGGTYDQIGFTSSASTLLEIISHHMRNEILKAGNVVVITEADHDPNRDPWNALSKRGIEVIDVSCTPIGGIDEVSYDIALSRGPKVVTLNMISNATGTIQPYQRLARKAKQAGAWIVLDAVQGLPHGFIDALSCGADLAAFSACKMFSPHMGWWAMRTELAAALGYNPPIGHHPTIECGRQPFAQMVGFSATCRYFSEQGRMGELQKPPDSGDRDAKATTARFMNRIVSYERDLSERFLSNIRNLPNTTLLGTGDVTRRVLIFALELPGVDWDIIRKRFVDAKVEARIGMFRCATLMKKITSSADGYALRVSFVHYNTIDNIDCVCGVLESLSNR